MKKRVWLRLFVTLTVALGCVWLLAGFPPRLSGLENRIRFGLDLEGGTHLELRVVTDDAVRSATDEALDRLRVLIAEESVSVGRSERAANGRIEVRGLNPNARSRIRELVADQFPEWILTTANDGLVLGLDPGEDARIRDQTVDQASRTIRSRIDSLGVAEASIQRLGGQGGDRLQVQLPGVDDLDRVRNLMQATAWLEFRLVEAGPFPSRQAAMSGYGTRLPDGMELMNSSDTAAQEEWYVVAQSAAVTGRDLKNARVARDEYGRPAVGFSLDAGGAERFARLTGANVGRRLAIVLDGRVESAPGIDGRITDSVIVRGGPGGFSMDEAEDLALVLRSGALPASLEYLADGYVSATLGSDSIRSGILAGIVSLAAIVLFMIGYYRVSGVIASLAMLLNILILMGVLAYFQAALTLPGIAGIVLTTGVGIDSNILIFERMREELRAGKTAMAAMTAGFNRVFRTLVDTHLSALIAAMFLFLFGTGAVQGFAVTLSVGLVSNMFTAVFVSRTLFEALMLYRGRGARFRI